MLYRFVDFLNGGLEFIGGGGVILPKLIFELVEGFLEVGHVDVLLFDDRQFLFVSQSVLIGLLQ